MVKLDRLINILSRYGARLHGTAAHHRAATGAGAAASAFSALRERLSALRDLRSFTLCCSPSSRFLLAFGRRFGLFRLLPPRDLLPFLPEEDVAGAVFSAVPDVPPNSFFSQFLKLSHQDAFWLTTGAGDAWCKPFTAGSWRAAFSPLLLLNGTLSVFSGDATRL